LGFESKKNGESNAWQNRGSVIEELPVVSFWKLLNLGNDLLFAEERRNYERSTLIPAISMSFPGMQLINNY